MLRRPLYIGLAKQVLDAAAVEEGALEAWSLCERVDGDEAEAAERARLIGREDADASVLEVAVGV